MSDHDTLLSYLVPKLTPRVEDAATDGLGYLRVRLARRGSKPRGSDADLAVRTAGTETVERGHLSVSARRSYGTKWFCRSVKSEQRGLRGQ